MYHSLHFLGVLLYSGLLFLWQHIGGLSKMHFDNNCGLAHKNLSSFALTPQQFYALLYSRILTGYQGIHITCQLKISSKNLLLAEQSKSEILNPVLWSVNQPQINGGNVKLIDHVTSLVPCKDSRTGMFGAQETFKVKKPQKKVSRDLLYLSVYFMADPHV